MSRLKLFIPLIIFAVLALLFLGVERQMESGEYNPTALPSALIDKPLPDFRLTALETGAPVSRADLMGQPFLLNVWATWCPTCHFEHPFLLELAERGEIALYGINYKDDPVKARQWLAERGNPFAINVVDIQGSLGLDLGVTGAPETYVVDHKGIVRLRYQGELDNNVWQQQFVPLLQTMREEQL